MFTFTALSAAIHIKLPHFSCIDLQDIKNVSIVFTRADNRRVTKAFSSVCDSVCLSVCLSVRTVKPKRLKLKSPNFVTIPRPSITIRSKGQGHRVKNAKRRSSGRRELCTLSSAQSLL